MLIGMVCILIYLAGWAIRIRKTYRYEVINIDHHKVGTVVTAKPVRRKLKHKEGQFSFLKVKKAGLREAHPFTIASGVDDRTLQFCISPCGDFTTRLKNQLAVGDRLSVEGPYGCFGTQKTSERQYWIAGGIGITPFIAMARSFPKSDGPMVSLIHIVRYKTDAFLDKEFKELALLHPNFTYHLHISSENGRWVPDPVANDAKTLFCGPESLLKLLNKSRKKVEHEYFRFS